MADAAEPLVKIKEEDFGLDEVCRACLGNDTELVDLFWKMNTSEKELTLADIFMMCTPVEVAKEDGKPQKLCESCIDNLTSAYEFRARCEQNDLFLDSMLSNSDDETPQSKPKKGDAKISAKHAELELKKEIKVEPFIDEGAEVAEHLKRPMDRADEDSEADSDAMDIVVEQMEDDDNEEPSLLAAIAAEQSDESQSAAASNYIYYSFVCDYCKKCFKSVKKYNKHVKSHGHHGKKPVLYKKGQLNACEICGETFEKKRQLNEHSVLHCSQFKRTSSGRKVKPTEKKRLSLSQEKMFLRELRKGDEAELIEREKKEKRELCKKEKEVTENLIASALEEDYDIEELKKEFVRTKAMHRPYSGNIKCNVCDKRFVRPSNIKMHAVEHVIRHIKQGYHKRGVSVSDCATLAAPFQCNICCEGDGQEFDKISKFKMHLWDSIQITTYLCPLCNKTFGNSSNFSKHKKVHGMHFYRCNLCKRKFSTAKMLDKHKEYHEDNQPIECCGLVFHFISTWKKHQRSAHCSGPAVKETNLYRCEMCAERFSSLKEQWEHAWQAHGSRHYEVDCDLCGQQFRTYSVLKKHVLEQHVLLKM